MNNHLMNQDEALIAMLQPKKVIEHFGGDISEIKKWADLNTEHELLISIKAFEREGLTEYVEVLNESLNSRNNNG